MYRAFIGERCRRSGGGGLRDWRVLGGRCQALGGGGGGGGQGGRCRNERWVLASAGGVFPALKGREDGQRPRGGEAGAGGAPLGLGPSAGARLREGRGRKDSRPEEERGWPAGRRHPEGGVRLPAPRSPGREVGASGAGRRRGQLGGPGTPLRPLGPGGAGPSDCARVCSTQVAEARSGSPCGQATLEILVVPIRLA